MTPHGAKRTLVVMKPANDASTPADSGRPATLGVSGQKDGDVSHPKLGDFVRVVSGPAYVKGQPIKGRVMEIAEMGRVALVKVASGGTWGFMLSDLRVLPRKAARTDQIDALSQDEAHQNIIDAGGF